MSFRRANYFPIPKGTNGTCESSLGGALSSKAVLGLCSTGTLMKYLRQLICVFKKAYFCSLFWVTVVIWLPGNCGWAAQHGGGGACGRVRQLPGRERGTQSSSMAVLLHDLGPPTRPHPMRVSGSAALVLATLLVLIRAA